MNPSLPFSSLPIGARFNLGGYDDVFIKTSEDSAISDGCPLLGGVNPVRIERKGVSIIVRPWFIVKPCAS